MAEHSASHLLLTNLFDGDIMMPHHGLVAQLGERTVRIRKVEGSIPFESTNKKATLTGGFLVGTVFTRMGSKAGTWLFTEKRFHLLPSSIFCFQHLGHFFRGFLAATSKPKLYDRIQAVPEKFNMIL